MGERSPRTQEDCCSERWKKRTGVIHQFAGCFRDGRNAKLIEHSVQELVGQRVYALALGYEDLNDHDDLRRDPLLAMLVGKEDPTGRNRRQEQDKGKPLAGKSTLNRLELHPGGESQDRYKKIAVDETAVERFLVKLFLDRYETPPARITLDYRCNGRSAAWAPGRALFPRVL